MFSLKFPYKLFPTQLQLKPGDFLIVVSKNLGYAPLAPSERERTVALIHLMRAGLNFFDAAPN